MSRTLSSVTTISDILDTQYICYILTVLIHCQTDTNSNKKLEDAREA